MYFCEEIRSEFLSANPNILVNIRHISKRKNVVYDALSQRDSKSSSSPVDNDTMARAQQDNVELETLLRLEIVLNPGVVARGAQSHPKLTKPYILGKLFICYQRL
ncbi:hypothetical protein TNCV_2760291 [Trichonephila clavipes]|nr:hypothetical protein TNCV_2760291 [Trichonephila clavipes]